LSLCLSTSNEDVWESGGKKPQIFLISAVDGNKFFCFTFRPFYSGTHRIEAEAKWAVESVVRNRKTSAPPRSRKPSSIPSHPLYWLSYPGSYFLSSLFVRSKSVERSSQNLLQQHKHLHHHCICNSWTTPSYKLCFMQMHVSTRDEVNFKPNVKRALQRRYTYITFIVVGSY